MPSVSVNPPKTPVTKGSSGTAAATIPNVCKMPGPPAPFVPAPLPNIGKSGDSPKGYSQDVTIEGKAVAIKGATFNSMGDMASKATGGGLISANTHGITKFVGPGSMDVKIEGKNVQLLSDPMLNNCAGGGSPPNSATLLGVLQMTGLLAVAKVDECPLCGKSHEGLKETEATKADAGVLASNYGSLAAKLSDSNDANNRNTMLGVVHCKCPVKYAAQSGKTLQVLRDAAKQAGMKHPGAGKVNVEAKIKAAAGNDAVFNKLWEEASSYSRLSLADTSKPVGYPPGRCAAQQAIVLCLDDKGIPVAVTERWYAPPSKPADQRNTDRPIRFIDATQPSVRGNPASPPVWKVADRAFAPGESVPPCATCEVILELLLCFEEEDPCHA
jgi:hypothetical protein